MHQRGMKIDVTKHLIPTHFFVSYHGRNNRDLFALRGAICKGHDFTQGKTPRPSSSGKLRIGFLSAYLRDHTIGRLNVGRIEQLDRSKFEVWVLLATQQDDEFTKRLERNQPIIFVRVPGRFQKQFPASVGLSLIFYCFAMLGWIRSRQALFTSRFAPLQVVTWGHPKPPVVKHIDYFLKR